MSITLIIVVITVLVSLAAWNRQEIFDQLIFNPYTVFHRRQWHRLFSSALLHADFMHLFINMYVLYSFGQFIEQVYNFYLPYGEFSFTGMYILSIAVANLKTLFENKNNVWYNALGASGAVSAVVFAYVLIAPVEKIYFFGVLPIPSFLYGGLYLAYSHYMAKKGNDNIGHDAHFFGAIFGFLFTGILKPELFLLFVKQIINQ